MATKEPVKLLSGGNPQIPKGDGMHKARFPILFTGANKAMVLLGLTRRNSYIDVDEHELVVQMGWAFRAVIPRSSVQSVQRHTGRVWAWGVHGWRGEWLVNGSSAGILRIDIEPVGRAHVIGVRVKLRILRVSIEDALGLQAALLTKRVG